MKRLIKFVVLATVLCALPWTVSQAAGSAPGHTADEVFVVPVKDHTWGGEIEPDKAITSQGETTPNKRWYHDWDYVLDIKRSACLQVRRLVDMPRLLWLKR